TSPKWTPPTLPGRAPPDLSGAARLRPGATRRDGPAMSSRDPAVPSSSPRPDPGSGSTAAAGQLVARNVFALIASQFVTTPVSMVVNAMLARSLGATSFGAVYFATTTLTLAFLVVEWGGGNQISA